MLATPKKANEAYKKIIYNSCFNSIKELLDVLLFYITKIQLANSE